MSCGIYKFQNKITCQVYIGQSTNLEERYRKHIRDGNLYNTNKFYKAVEQWGWDNFSYEVIELCDRNELNDREKFWINYYDSFRHGYNMTKGGSNKYSVDEKKIYNLYDSGLNPKEISDELQIGLTTVYKYLSCYSKFKKSKNGKIVYQYNLNGQFVKAWESRAEAERSLKIAENSIEKVLANKRISAGGFLWSEEKIENFIPQNLPYIIKPILQYDLNDNLINEFSNAKEAALYCGKKDSSAIRKVCKGKMNTAYGYKWKYKY